MGIFFDIETGGFRGTQNPILSVSWAKDKEEVKSLYARPTIGTSISRWSEKKVWEPIKSRGVSLLKEQEVLMGFLEVLEGAPVGTQLMGWNIGYVAAAQGVTRAGGFDIPMIMSRAKQFGLEERYRKAFNRMKIRDIGAIHAFRVAKAVAADTVGWNLVEQGVLHPTLHKEAVGFLKQAGKLAAESGLTSEADIAEALSRKNIRFSGWKQELMYQLIQGKELAGAHQSAEDVRALRELSRTKVKIDEDFLRKWARGALENKLISRAKYVPIDPKEAIPARYQGIIREAEEWGIREGVEKKLRLVAAESGVPFSFVKAGRGIPTKERVVRGVGKPQLLDFITPLVKRHWGKIGIGAVATALFALKPGSWFSDSEDNLEDLFTPKVRSPFSLSGMKRGETIEDLDVSERFSFLKKALEEYGKATGTGHKRLVFPKEFLKEEQLEKELGFVPVSIAVPEAGQDIFQSWRHPFHEYHIHSHEDEWTMHEDEHSASTMLVEREKIRRKQQSNVNSLNFLENVEINISSFFKGLPHLIGEGVPGVAYYLANQMFSSEDLAEQIKEKLPLRYMNFMYGNEFSATDDRYNLIEGLQHGGQAERMRHFLTDFRSPVDLVKAANRAAKLYKKHITKSLKGSGVSTKGITWESMVDPDDLEGVAVYVMAKSKEGELLAGMSRMLGEGAVDLTQIEVGRNLPAGLGKSLYKGEADILRKIGYEAGEKITSPVSSPITARWQFQMYGSKIDPQHTSRILSQTGMAPEHFREAVMAKAVSKEDFLGITITGKIPKVYDKQEAMPVSGLAAKTRSLFGFESGSSVNLNTVASLAEGIFNLPKSLKGTLGTTALTGTTERLGRHIAENIMTAEKKGLSGGPIKRWLTKRKVTQQKKDFYSLIEQFRKSSFKKQVILDPYAIGREAKSFGISAEIRTRQLVGHEKVQEVFPVPEKFSVPFAAWRQKEGFKELSEVKMFEEYIAHSAELAGVKQVPEHFKSGVEFYQKLQTRIATEQKLASRPNSSILEPSRQKLKRKAIMQLTHREAQKRSSGNALRPGKRHRSKAGRIVL
jgi:hypothetical protein